MIRIIRLVIILSFLLNIKTCLAATEVGGPLFVNTTWTAAGSPYIVKTTVYVHSGVRLEIEPGVIVKFDDPPSVFDPGFSLLVDGLLLARGTNASKITFTSSSGTPGSQSWGGIYFSENAVEGTLSSSGEFINGSIVENSIIKYAKCAIAADEKIPFIRSIEIEDSYQGFRLASSANTKINIKYCTFRDCSAGSIIISYKNFDISECNFFRSRGLYISSRNNFNVNIYNSTFEDCIDVAILMGTKHDIYEGMLNIDNCVFKNNISGAVTTFGVSNISVSDSLFLSNGPYQTDGRGGALSINGNKLAVDNCIFEDNSSLLGGGAIYSSYSSTIMSVKNSKFLTNRSPNDRGGAIDGSGDFSNCEFINNKARDGGGAIAGSGTISNCLFKGNIAGYGGAVHFRGVRGVIRDSQFIANGTVVDPGSYGFIWGNGGAIVSLGSTSNIDRCLFYLNGGSSTIYTEKIVIENSTIVSKNTQVQPAYTDDYRYTPFLSINQSNLIGNDIYKVSGVMEHVDATHNYWGTVDLLTISLSIRDRFDSPTGTGGEVDFIPILTSPSPTAPPIPTAEDFDKDDDSDGIVNYFDNCPTKKNPNQLDFDNDGIGDSCDADMDGDDIDDTWEWLYFADLATLGKYSDYDSDGYSDFQEYINSLSGTDPDGNNYNPMVENAPEGTGYRKANNILLMILPTLMNHNKKLQP